MRRSGIQLGVDARGVIHVDGNVFQKGLLETRRGHRDRVGPGLKMESAVEARGIGFGFSRDCGLNVGDLDSSSRDYRPAGVRHITDDRALCELRLQGG